MPLYMYQAGYTAEAVAGLIKEPEHRIEAVRPALKAMGVEIQAGGYSLGEYDVTVIFEAPDDTTTTAAAVALAIAAGGAIRSARTTRLLTGDEWLEALGKASRSKYKPALDLNFSAVNTAAENDANRNIFISGILFGVLGGTAVAAVDHIFEGFRGRKGKPPYHKIGL